MLVKVCGMRDGDNIRELLNLDIDFMGMIFYEKSPRFISKPPEVLFPEKVQKTGVFVNATFKEIMDVAKKFNLDAIQLHGHETPEFCSKISQAGYTVLKAFGIDEKFNFEDIRTYEKACSFFVFDTKTKGYGGSGKKFNWEKLEEYQGDTGFLLSGGISPEDINTLKQFSHPQFKGVDLNSGFEIKPGIKNIEELKLFINELKSIT